MEHQSRSSRRKPAVDLELFERALQFQDTFGGQSSRLGLGFNSVAKFRDCPLKMKRKMVAEHCKREEAHERKVKLLALARNSDFVKWDLDMISNRDWTNQIFGMSPELLAFTLNGQANTLPSPSNLRRWGFHSSTHHCILCGKLGTTAKHTLSNCPVALKSGRYTWRHNNVLRTLFPDLVGLISSTNRSAPKPRQSNHRQPFVRAGAKPHAPKALRSSTNVLDLANDWILLVDDVPSRTVFPPCTGVDTTMRPDIIIYSKSMKIIIWGELTVPLEENINAAAIRKRIRYSVSTKEKVSLADQCRRNDWTVYDFTFEVGSMGFVGYSTRRFLSKLGFKSSHLKWLLTRISRIAMRSSYLIWCCRKERTWEPPEFVPIRIPTSVQHNTGPSTSTQHKTNKNEKEPSREAALNFLATISSSVNPEPNPTSPPRRPPQLRPTPPDYKYTYEDEYETLAEEAEEFDDFRPPSPFEPDGPDAEPSKNALGSSFPHYLQSPQHTSVA
jgi:hypothetical protein